MNNLLILVVEDDAPVRKLIGTTLKMHNYDYMTATSGESAIMMASSHNPDVVLLDLGLPDIDGIDIIKKIRTWSQMPIIVISARTEDKDKIDALDVGAVGKGYAVERSAQALVERGCKSYVLNVGGNIRTIGTKVDGSGWITGIKDPLNPDSKYAMYLSLTDTSCVTSGTYERYFIVDRVKYHHIIDCETLMPANYFISVSIITKDSGLADALSTALFCMSYEEGKALIEKLENVDVLWIYSDGSLKYTSGIKPIEQNN